MSSQLDIIITVDRSMMTNHHGKEFIGFMTTAPPVGLPDRIWTWIAEPPIKTDEKGRPAEAPYGLRKIEAALQNAGFNAEIIDPDHIIRYVETAKAVFIGHHDYFGFCPPSSEWWLVTGEEPINRRTFLAFMKRVARAKKELNPELKIVVGGPSSWQWLYVPEYLREFMVDTVVEGEGEKAAVYLAEKIMSGEKLPRYIMVGPEDSPRLDEIPVIKAASVNGLVEIMRGCPRRCKFCSVTLRPLRFIPLDMIEKELQVNVRAGIKGGIVHSEDVLLYGAKGVIPNPDALIKLHTLVKKYYKTFTWSHAALSTVLVAEERFKLITRLKEIMGEQDYFGFQTGIETGSPRLAREIMPAKAAPYPAEKWPEIVEEAFKLLHEKRIIPAATLIVGLPGETPDDVIRTIELIERLKPYRSLIVPMFFVPMGALRKSDWFKAVNVTREHAELMLVVLRHSVYWAKDIVNKFYLNKMRHAPLRFLLNRFLGRTERFAEKLTPDDILMYIERSKKKMMKRIRQGKMHQPFYKRATELVESILHIRHAS